MKADQSADLAGQTDLTKLAPFTGSTGDAPAVPRSGALTQSWLKVSKSLNHVAIQERAARTPGLGTSGETDTACPSLPEFVPTAPVQGMSAIPVQGSIGLTGPDAGAPPAGHVASEPSRGVVDIAAVPLAGARVAPKSQGSVPASPPIGGEAKPHEIEAPSELFTGLSPPAPITVGPTPAIVARPSARPASAITEQVVPAMLSVVSGAAGPVLTLHLNPGELGAIRVTVARDEAGATGVTLTVERPGTMRLLNDDMAHLHAALDTAGIPQIGRTLSLHLQVPDLPATPTEGVAHNAPSMTTSSISISMSGQGMSDQASGADGNNRGGQRQPAGVPRQADVQHSTEAAPDDNFPRGTWYRAGIDITA